VASEDGLFRDLRIAAAEYQIADGAARVAETILPSRAPHQKLSQQEGQPEPVSADEAANAHPPGLPHVCGMFRPPRSYAAGHLPGALKLPLPQLAKQTGTSSLRTRDRGLLPRRIACFSYDAVEMLRSKSRKARASPRVPRMAERGIAGRAQCPKSAR